MFGSTVRLVIAHVGILRFVAQFGRKFSVSGVDVTSIARQQRVITLVENRKRPGHDFEETGNAPDCTTAETADDAIAGGSGVTLVGIDFSDGHSDFSGGEEEVR